MAFKMKGHTLPGINQRMDKSSLTDGRAKSSAFQVAGAFITDVDELTGKKTERRATYKDTRAAEKKGKKVTYTNKEAAMRTKADIKKARDEGNEEQAKGLESNLKGRKNWVKKNKSDAYSKKYRKMDRAAQDVIEGGKKVLKHRRDDRDLLADNKTSIRKDKPNLNESGTNDPKHKDTGKMDSSGYPGISQTIEAKKKGAPMKASPAKHWRTEDKSMKGGDNKKRKKEGTFVIPAAIRHNEAHDAEGYVAPSGKKRAATEYAEGEKKLKTGAGGGSINKRYAKVGDFMDKPGFDKFGNKIEGYVAPPFLYASFL